MSLRGYVSYLGISMKKKYYLYTGAKPVIYITTIFVVFIIVASVLSYIQTGLTIFPVCFVILPALILGVGLLYQHKMGIFKCVKFTDQNIICKNMWSKQYISWDQVIDVRYKTKIKRYIVIVIRQQQNEPLVFELELDNYLRDIIKKNYKKYGTTINNSHEPITQKTEKHNNEIVDYINDKKFTQNKRRVKYNISIFIAYLVMIFLVYNAMKSIYYINLSIILIIVSTLVCVGIIVMFVQGIRGVFNRVGINEKGIIVFSLLKKDSYYWNDVSSIRINGNLFGPIAEKHIEIYFYVDNNNIVKQTITYSPQAIYQVKKYYNKEIA